MVVDWTKETSTELTLQAERRVVKLVAARITVNQQRPPLLSRVNLNGRPHQITDRALRRRHHLNRPQAPLYGHVHEELRRPPARSSAVLRGRFQPSRWYANEAAASLSADKFRRWTRTQEPLERRVLLDTPAWAWLAPTVPRRTSKHGVHKFTKLSLSKIREYTFYFLWFWACN